MIVTWHLPIWIEQARVHNSTKYDPARRIFFFSVQKLFFSTQIFCNNRKWFGPIKEWDIKFQYFEKATKIWKNIPILMTKICFNFSYNVQTKRTFICTTFMWTWRAHTHAKFRLKGPLRLSRKRQKWMSVVSVLSFSKCERFCECFFSFSENMIVNKNFQKHVFIFKMSFEMSFHFQVLTEGTFEYHEF